MYNPISVNTKRACPLSGSHSAYVVSDKDRHGENLRNVISKESGLIFVDPIPFENTEEFYKKEYRKSYKGIITPKKKHIYRAGKNALSRYNRIKSTVDIGDSILDAGSSSGEFVYLLKSRGHKAKGLEANEGYAMFGKKELGIDVEAKAFSEFKSELKFDAITMFHVLEHLENPISTLEHLSSFLKPDGFLIIEVPNILYPSMSFIQKWHPGHLFSYCTETLAKIAEGISMEVVLCETISDGGNIFSVFKKSPIVNPEQPSTKFIPEDKLKLLLVQKRRYFFKVTTYLKFMLKIKKSVTEWIKTKSKSPKAILDEIYK